MSRRGRGEGTVTKDGSGWIARIELPPGPDGKRRRRKRRTRTKAAAYEALRELQKEFEEAVNPDGANRTVAEAVENFLAVQPKANRAATTIYLDEWRAGMIVSGLGRKRLGQLTVSDCDALLRDVSAGVFGARTINADGVRRTRSLLIKVIHNEMRIGNLVRNVAELSVVPADERRADLPDGDGDGDSNGGVRRSLSYDDFRRLWRVARSPLVVVVELCGRNGLRPSEARGLRWECVDLEDRTLTVNRQMSSSNRLTGPKTKRSQRTIPVDDQTVACLLGWQAAQGKKRDRAGELWSDDPDLLISTRFGTPINRHNLGRMMTAACEEADIEVIVPYELRHTAITFQLDAGHEAWRVADWAGTSERMIEEIYRHRLTRVSDLGPVNVGGWDADS